MIDIIMLLILFTLVLVFVFRRGNGQKSDVVVIGGFFTAIIGIGLDKMPKIGEVTFGEKITFGPGGKSANIARMCATLNTKVAMIGLTTKDVFGLWKLPIQSLREVGVNVNHVSISKTKSLPGIGIIAVNKKGNNRIYGFPGINTELSKREIIKAKKLFINAKILAMALEFPYETSLFSIDFAQKHNLKVFLDSGGISARHKYDDLLSKKIFFFKPNEQEVKILTKILVTNSASAKKAAKEILKFGTITHLLITVGKNGAYYFSKNQYKRYIVPKLNITSESNDAGCGDQTMAAIVATYNNTSDINKSIQIGLLAGTIQFYKSEISPVTNNEIKRNVYK